MSPYEIAMLVLFGVSWPISIDKALRTKKVEGKSPLFMSLVCIGYLCGILHKSTVAFDCVTALYALNLMMILLMPIETWGALP